MVTPTTIRLHQLLFCRYNVRHIMGPISSLPKPLRYTYSCLWDFVAGIVCRIGWSDLQSLLIENRHSQAATFSPLFM